MLRSRGFTYIGLLIAVVLLGIGLALVGEVWNTAVKRDRERELLFVGDQFRQAIGRYYESSPGVKQYPRKLEDLLEDKRFPVMKRYLRRIYLDPMTGKADWGLVMQGIRSSASTVLRRTRRSRSPTSSPSMRSSPTATVTRIGASSMRRLVPPAQAKRPQRRIRRLPALVHPTSIRI